MGARAGGYRAHRPGRDPGRAGTRAGRGGQVLVPDEKAGRAIGRGGAVMDRLVAASGARVRLSAPGEFFPAAHPDAAAPAGGGIGGIGGGAAGGGGGRYRIAVVAARTLAPVLAACKASTRPGPARPGPARPCGGAPPPPVPFTRARSLHRAGPLPGGAGRPRLPMALGEDWGGAPSEAGTGLRWCSAGPCGGVGGVALPAAHQYTTPAHQAALGGPRAAR